MSPLTILLAKLLGLYCIIVALAMMTRKQSAVSTVKAPHRESAAFAARRSDRPRGRPRHDHWSQYLVGRRVARRCHPRGMADGDPRHRAARPAAGCDDKVLRGSALRRAFLRLHGRNSGPGSFSDLCGLQRVMLRARNGQAMFRHANAMGLEMFVSTRRDRPRLADGTVPR
jgi:hypothetical protein